MTCLSRRTLGLHQVICKTCKQRGEVRYGWPSLNLSEGCSIVTCLLFMVSEGFPFRHLFTDYVHASSLLLIQELTSFFNVCILSTSAHAISLSFHFGFEWQRNTSAGLPDCAASSCRAASISRISYTGALLNLNNGYKSLMYDPISKSGICIASCLPDVIT